MIRESTLDQLRPHLRDYLMQYMGRNPDKPFSCVNPSHPDKHPSGYYGAKENIVGCHSCHCQYNLFSLIGLNEGIPDFQGQVERAAQLYGVQIEYEKGKGGRRSTPQEDFAEPPEGQNHIKTERKQATAPTADYTAFFAEAHAHLRETDYPQRRGLSAAVCNRFNLGYVAEWRHPKVEAERQKGRYQNVPSSPRLIIPTSAHSYLARDTRPDADPQYKKQKAGEVAIFNIEALRSAARPVFLTEGEIDALSIIEAGGEAVALGSTSYTDIFFRSLDSMLRAGAQITQPIIICLDNDAAGADAAGKLEEGLRERGLPSYRRDISGGHKDANEALVSDRAGLEAAMAAAEEEAKAEAAAEDKRLSMAMDNFIRKTNKDLQVLHGLFSFEEKVKGKPLHVENLSLIGFSEIKRGFITIEFTFRAAEYLVAHPLTQYGDALYAISDRHPNAYILGLLLVERYNLENNQIIGTADRIMIEKLLDKLDLMPIEKVRKERRSWETFIKDRFEDALEALVTAGLLTSWEYCKAKGVPLTDQEAQSITAYEDWSKLYVHFSLVNAPDHSKAIKASKERAAIKAAEKKKAARKSRTATKKKAEAGE